MSKNIRIRTEPNSGDKHIKFQLNQDFDFLEILSLKISQEDIYRSFYSDYGVVVGRISVNSGVGVPNAKVSIFIPLTDDDAQNPEISKLYPYSDISIVNSDGIRYNLLPEESQGICHTPIGTFPTKNKLMDNEPLLEIYDKYYKYTTTTNDSGDFMLFGVPVGNHTINVDVDLSDIGIYSQRPYDFIDQGNPKNLFTSSTKFKSGKNLNNLTQLKNRQVGINVIPFWGEKVSNEVGISRVDVDLNYNLEPKAIFIGSLFGDNEKNSVNKNCKPRKKLGKVCEMSEGGGTINMLRKTIHGENERFDIEGGRVIDDNGVWAYQIPMNLDYMVTNEYGELIRTEDTTKGIPTRSSVRFKIDPDSSGGEGRIRTKANYLVPHNPTNTSEVDYTFDERTSNIHFRDFYWNKIYTVKNHITRFQKNGDKENRHFVGFKDVDDCVGTKNPIPFNTIDDDWNPIFVILCVIIDIIIAVSRVIAIVKKTHLPCDGQKYRIKVSKNRNGDRSDDFKKCIRLQLAEALNVYEMDFYNDWLNGSLYAYLLKYKKIKNDEKYCGDGNGDDDNKLINTNTGDFNVSSNSKQSVNISEGLVASYEGELIYKPITKEGNLLYATDIFNLGSVFNCDWQGIVNTNTSLIPTTYQFPEFDDIGLLFDLKCVGGVKMSDTNSKNTKRMCEIGVEWDDDNFIDESDIPNSIVRNQLIILNNKEYKNSTVSDINTGFESIDYGNYRLLKKVNNLNQSFGNSFYFYFGTIPNKTAIEVMNSKYFSPCIKEVKNIIIITGVVTNVSTINGNDGAITISVSGGKEDYTYMWLDSLENQIPHIDGNISNLEKGLYTVTVTDDNGVTNSKNFNVGGLSELQMTVSNRNSLPNVDGDGVIYVSGLSGGVSPYDVTITGGSGPYYYSGIYGGVTLENLANGAYTVTCTDNEGNQISSAITIDEVDTLSISNVVATPISCIEINDGVITYQINGGTSPFVTELTDSNNNKYSGTEITGLGVGDYELIVCDSYSQNATTSTITIGDALPLIISYSPTTLLLTNTISGTNYNLFNNGSLVTTILATGSTIQYNITVSGAYSFISESDCESDEIIITI